MEIQSVDIVEIKPEPEFTYDYYLIDVITNEVDDIDSFTASQVQKFNSDFEENGQPYEWVKA